MDLPRGVFAHNEKQVTALVRALGVGNRSDEASAPHVSLVSAESSVRSEVPVMNSIRGWSNAQTDVWILRQKAMREAGWRSYGIVQDKTVSPNVAFYFSIAQPDSLVFLGESCFKCHASGPRYIRPIRQDLIEGEAVAETFNERIEGNGYVRTHFSATTRKRHAGPPLTASACIGCHSIGGVRGPLYHDHDESIEVLVAIGAMPRDSALSAAELSQIQAWLAAERP